MLFKSLLALSDNSMIKLYCESFSFEWYFNNDMAISSNESRCKTKNNSECTGLIMMTLPGDSIVSKISADCYESSFHRCRPQYLVVIPNYNKFLKVFSGFKILVTNELNRIKRIANASWYLPLFELLFSTHR